MKRRTSAAAALALLALTTAGACSSNTQASITPPSSPTATAQTDTSTPSSILPPPTTASPTPSTYPIGYTFTYTDGVSVTVTSLSRFTPSDTSTGLGPGQVGVLATITIRNNSGANLDLVSLVNLYAGPNGNQADSVFDSAQGVNGFEGAIPPGHAATGKFAFSVTPSDLGELVITVQPGFNYETASFQGALS